MPAAYTISERIVAFWARVTVAGADDCWPWLGATGPNGYGIVRWEDRQMRSPHSVAFELANGWYPKYGSGQLLRHRCGMRLCCNEVHLHAGSHAENSADMVRHGRSGRANRDYQWPKVASTLTPDNVREIRRMLTEGRARQAEIGALFGVGQSAISAINRGKTWSDLR